MAKREPKGRNELYNDLQREIDSIKNDEWVEDKEFSKPKKKSKPNPTYINNKKKYKKPMSKPLMAFLIIIIIISLAVLGYAGWNIFKIEKQYISADLSYEDLVAMFEDEDNNDLRKLLEKYPGQITIDGMSLEDFIAMYGSDLSAILKRTDGILNVNGIQLSLFDIAVPFKYDYNVLKKYIPNAVGWIYLRDYINYPIMLEDEDNPDYYLTHLPDGTYNDGGSLFAEFRFEDGLDSPYCIVHGHNMKNHSMFGNLHNYHDEEFYKEHRKMHVFSGSRHYVYNIIGTFNTLVKGYVYETTSFYNQWDYDAYIDQVKADSEYPTYEGDLNYQDNNILVLSTCTTNLDYSYRYVVILARDHEVKSR